MPIKGLKSELLAVPEPHYSSGHLE